MTTPIRQRNERERWKNSILAGFANYIDSGSILAGAAALAIWVEHYNLSDRFVGLLAAFSANAISAGVGALIGGRLCDKYGRKKIYQYDMLFYAFGMAWLVFASQPWMIVVGFVLVGLAVGADIPASWSLIAESAPQGERGKHGGIAYVLWSLGPIVVLLMSLALARLGMLGVRIVFAHLLILALLLTFLRSRMQESELWAISKAAEEGSRTNAAVSGSGLRQLLEPRYLKAMLFLIGVYGIWNLWAGTLGFFFPYILHTVGGQSQEVSLALRLISPPIAIATVILIFMRYSDRVNQRLLFGLSALISVAAMALLAALPLTVPVVILYAVLMSFADGFGTQPFFQLWSAELFPTLLRSTAQGITFAVVRIGLGLWSLFVPVLVSTNFKTLAWILTGFLAVSGLIGVIWAPRNEGKSLEQIEREANVNECRPALCANPVREAR